MVTLYSKQSCENCEKLKAYFDKNGVAYNVVKLSTLGELPKYFEDTIHEERIYDFSSFPIVVDGSFIGGYAESMEHYYEPLLADNPNKYSLYPITYPDVYEMYKKSRASYWQPEEISLAKDMEDWETMNADEKHFVSHVLAFFSASDGIVVENIDVNFSKDVQIPEVRAFYAFQEAMEAIHSETYSILLDKYVVDLDKKQHLQEGIRTIASIKKKADWTFRYMHKDQSFAKRLVAFACVEGIYFSGSFCAIYWLKKRNLLPGLAFSNELISRDEGLHTDFSVLLYNKLNNRIAESDVHHIVGEAVQNDKEFIIESLPCKLIGMNSDLMSQYIEFVADRLLVNLGYTKLYYSSCPFDFMENISLNGKTNFFEKRVGEYAKANVMNSSEDNAFDLDADF